MAFNNGYQIRHFIVPYLFDMSSSPLTTGYFPEHLLVGGVF